MKKATFLCLSLLMPFLVFSQASLSSVSPNSAHPMKILDVTITGNNTHFSTATGTVVKFGFLPATSTAVINKMTIVDQSTIITNITVPYATYGAYDVSVNNSTDGLITLPGAFNVTVQPTPLLVSVNPKVGNAGQTLTLKLKGHQTNFKTGLDLAASIDFQGPANPYYTIYAHVIHIIDDSTLEAEVSIPEDVYTGDYRIKIYNSTDGIIYITKGFHVNGLVAPTLRSISPSTGRAGEILNVTITGNNTSFKQGYRTKVIFGFNQATGTGGVNSVSVLSDSTLQANVTLPPDQPDGDYDVYVEDSIDNTITLAKGFHVGGPPIPTLSTVSPQIVQVDQTLNVTITGYNTHFRQAGLTSVKFMLNQAASKIVVNSVTAVNETELNVNITVPPDALTGNYDIETSNSLDGIRSLQTVFHVHEISTTSLVYISPPNVNAGQTLDVTIHGRTTHFIQNNTSLTFRFKSATSTIVINSLSATTDSTLKANITIPANSTSGYYTVSVSNPTDGLLSLDNMFYVNGIAPASILSVSPSEVKAGQTLDVTITGARTHFTTIGNFVHFGFQQATGTTIINSTTVISDTILNVNITVPSNAAAGNYSVSVFNTVDGQLLYYNFKVAGNCHAFYSSSYNPITNIFTLALDSATSMATSFYWDFGDGTTSTNKFPEHGFGLDALYNVCLKIKTITGDSCSYCHIIGKDSLGNPVNRMKGFSTKVVPYIPVITGIKEAAGGKPILIYPNPAADILNVVTYHVDLIPVLSIYSLDAKLLLRQIVIKENTEVDVSRFSKGMYIIELKDKERINRLKFMKQ